VRSLISSAVVGHRQASFAIPHSGYQSYANPTTVLTERVLNAVGGNFIQNQTKGYGAVDRQFEIVCLYVDLDTFRLLPDGHTQDPEVIRQLL
jgi:hypothetical protein